ncbi:MAG: hypothetical protein ACR2HX_13020 [Pyrinomonadaceae bacterium]|nr:hypothetical protein [Pyrinomonadaceae bacterium]
MGTQTISFQVDPAQIEEVARRVFREMQSSSSELCQSDPEIEMVKHRLDRIMAKEFITLSEAAFLLSCSDGHIRNLLKKAHSGETERLIPVRDLDGVFVFNLEELLAWSREAKSKTAKERKSSLRDVSAKVS